MAELFAVRNGCIAMVAPVGAELEHARRRTLYSDSHQFWPSSNCETPKERLSHSL